MEDCLVFDCSVADVEPNEAVPLLRHSSVPLSRQNFEMASVHKSSHRVCTSDNFKVTGLRGSARFSGINPSLDMDAELSCCNPPSRVNVIEALETFWKKKLHNESTGVLSFANEAPICYTVEPVTRPPFKCYVTLPNGCCFGNLLSECGGREEACRSAAHVAFVNSLYNELPCRKISDSLIETAVHEATVASSVVCGGNRSLEGIDVFRSILESTRGKTMLDYAAFVNRLLAMHWSGTLQSMSRGGASRQQVLEAASSRHWFAEDRRSEMARRWIAVERRDPGTVDAELGRAESELESAQGRGRELAFPRLKRDVLRLAASQVS